MEYLSMGFDEFVRRLLEYGAEEDPGKVHPSLRVFMRLDWRQLGPDDQAFVVTLLEWYARCSEWRDVRDSAEVMLALVESYR